MITEGSKTKIKELTYKLNKEVCGFIINNNDKELVIPVKNHSIDPEKHFEINPRDFLIIKNIGEIKCLFHSHLSKKLTFSDTDKKTIVTNLINGLVYSVKSDEFNEIDIDKYKKYLGTPFEIGKNDCLSLVSRFYKEEYDIIIPERNRGEGWYLNDEMIINKIAQENKYKLLPFEKVEKHDIIAFDTLKRGNICHLGIYIDENIVLHHPRKRASKLDLLSWGLKNCVVGILRQTIC